MTISDYVADLRAATPSNAAELAVPDQESLAQSLDSMSMAMAASLNRQLKGARQHLDVLSKSAALQSPTGYLDQKRKTLELLQNRLVSAQSRIVDRKKQQFVANVSKLDAMSPLKVLTRGYALAHTDDGALLKSVNQVNAGDRIVVDLSDGKLTASVLEKENS